VGIEAVANPGHGLVSSSRTSARFCDVHHQLDRKLWSVFRVGQNRRRDKVDGSVAWRSEVHMETSERRGGWSWRKTLVVALAIAAVIALAVVLVASAGGGSGGGLY
jgi:anti-sigma-K factor RskA